MPSSDIHNVHVGKAVQLMLIDLGLDVETVLRLSGLPTGLLQGEGSKISLDDFYSLWRVVTEEVNDPRLPLKLSDIGAMDYFDPAFFAAMCSPNLNIALTRLSKFKSLVGPFALEVTIQDEMTCVVFRCKTRPDVPPTLALTELLFLVNFARRATRQQIIPVSVSMPDQVPEIQVFNNHFGSSLSIGNEACLTFTAEDAQRPFLTHDHAMWSFFEPQLRQRMNEVRAEQSTQARVESVLTEILPSGRLSADVVARELALSKRTLQRRLSEEGTTWQKVLDGSRQSLAKHYLLNTDLGATELSFLLGFEDPNSLFRAFKRWEGTSPEAWRSRQKLIATR